MTIDCYRGRIHYYSIALLLAAAICFGCWHSAAAFCSNAIFSQTRLHTSTHRRQQGHVDSSNHDSSFARRIPDIRLGLSAQDEDAHSCSRHASHLVHIRTTNLVGMDSHLPANDIQVDMGESHLITVTGESGSGKSLLFSKACRLLLGDKASTLLTSSLQKMLLSKATKEVTAMVELKFNLQGDHLKAFQESLSLYNIDYTRVSSTHETVQKDGQDGCHVTFKRTLSYQSTDTFGKAKLKSVCDINGHGVTLKTISALLSPLVSIIDASSASQALSRPKDRLAMLDTAVSRQTIYTAKQARLQYQRARQRRESIEAEISKSSLPKSFSLDSDEDLSKLVHWISELDAFETRVMKMSKSLDGVHVQDSSLMSAMSGMSEVDWMDDRAKSGVAFQSEMYERLLDFRDAVRSLEDRLSSAQQAAQLLSSLSEDRSVVSALARVRKLLLKADDDSGKDGKVPAACEQTHDLLNNVEVAVRKCAKSLEESDRGLVDLLSSSYKSCPYSIEEIDGLLMEWTTLARKHGVSPSQLPNCHYSLRRERDGNVEARVLLPQAKEEEKEALLYFEQACAKLSVERLNIADNVGRSISQRLPSLGMDNSRLEVVVSTGNKQCTDQTVYSSGSVLGVDDVDFALIHSASSSNKDEVVGSVHAMASSGEKARILLAIECSLPGAVGVLNRFSDDTLSGTDPWSQVPPIVILYDEIDAHVGGRAAVSIANMLSQQSDLCQIIAITHSPAVAAAADMHVVVQSQPQLQANGSPSLMRTVHVVDGLARRSELARMASGDLASAEAESLAEALLRNGRQRSQTV
jgi:DNA repair ATPase RecN